MPRKKLELSPSLICADLLQLGSTLEKLTQESIDRVHIDLADGHFVDSLGFPCEFISAVREQFQGKIEVHLMVAKPMCWVNRVASAGASRICFHLETTPSPEQVVKEITNYGCQAGVALGPGVLPDNLSKLLPNVAYIQVMSVHPGHCGQQFIYEALNTIRAVRVCIDSNGPPRNTDIHVDGGITPSLFEKLASAGADVLVLGTNSIFANRRMNLPLLRHLKSKVDNI